MDTRLAKRGVTGATIALVLAMLFSSTCLADNPWRSASPPVSFSTPSGFSKVSDGQTQAALQLFDPSRNTEIVLSKGSEKRLVLASYRKGFPKMIEAQGGKVVSSEMVSAGKDPGVLFLVQGLLPEKVEQIYIYVAPPKADCYSLVVNYPAAKREQTMKLVRGLLSTVIRR